MPAGVVNLMGCRDMQNPHDVSKNVDHPSVRFATAHEIVISKTDRGLGYEIDAQP